MAHDGTNHGGFDPSLLEGLFSAAALGGPNPSVGPSGASVYLGTRSNPPGRFTGKQVPLGEKKTTTLSLPQSVDDIRDTDSAYAEFDRWYAEDQGKLRDWATLMESRGILEPGSYSYEDLRQKWLEAVDGAARIYGNTQKKITPHQYVDLMATGMGTAGSGAKPHTTTQTETSTTLATRADARAILTNTLQQELGRSPTSKEVGAFFKALRAAQASKPSVTTQTRRTKPNKRGTRTDITGSSVTKGGVDTGAFAQNFVDDKYDAERDARAGATGYYGALLSLTGRAV